MTPFPLSMPLTEIFLLVKASRDIGAYRVRIQAAMGIPKIEFHELDPRWVYEQLTEEEIQLKADL